MPKPHRQRDSQKDEPQIQLDVAIIPRPLVVCLIVLGEKIYLKRQRLSKQARGNGLEFGGQMYRD